MNGKGILGALGVAFGHLVNTYVVDIRAALSGKKRDAAAKSSHQAEGIFTIEYPEEKLPVPEEFRYIPFLVYEEAKGENGTAAANDLRCTACGICAKVCPPQCIWIVRSSDPNTGKPVPAPAQFYIDVDICMNCGFCAEYCPFDAIKMDHDYEIASLDRFNDNIYDLTKLSKPVSYYATIRPTNYAREEAARAAEAAAKAARKAGAGTTATN